ncbi:hypothetical protein [Ruminococcus sp.]|uniref:hypothetical protein n=1 Tax=Ruminococcus sp. TaxID=41978 RepID=UPI0026014C09|nr:hypothetical protein [Ruminococcus sp.]
MKKTKNSAWKRVAAGALSMALVAGAMPANVGGLLTGGNAIVAHAAEYASGQTVNVSSLKEGDILESGVKIIEDQDYDLFINNNSMGYLHSTGNGEWNVNAKYIVDKYEQYNSWYRLYLKIPEEENSVTFSENDTKSGISVNGIKTPYGFQIHPPYDYRYLTITADNTKIIKSVQVIYANNVSEYVELYGNTTHSTQNATKISDNGWTNINSSKFYIFGQYKQEINGGAAEMVKFVSVTYADKINISNEDYTAPTAKNSTFTGDDQPLLNAGTIEASKGAFQYALGTDATNAPTGGWSTTIPERTNAGPYYVWYKIIGADNYNDVAPVAIPVTIGKASINPSIVIKVGDQTATTFPYNTDYDVSVTADSNPGNGDVTYEYAPKTGTLMPGDNDSWKNVKPTEVGSYWVKATVAETANYAGATASAVLTINKASIIVNPLPQLAQDLEYNTNSQALVDAANAAISPSNTFEIKYLVTAENAEAPAANAEGWSASIPAKTAAGTYKVWYKVDGNDSYNSIAPTPLGIVEIAKAKDTIQTAPEFNGDDTDATKVYYYQDGQDIDIVFNTPNGAHGQIEYAWKPANASESWVPGDSDWSTNIPKRTAVGTYTLLYRSQGDGVNYDPSDVCSATIEVQGITTNEQINKFNAGETEILRLDSDINGNVLISRNGGIIDLNGHRISGCLMLQNRTNPIIVMNGRLGAGKDAIDDGGGYQSQWQGKVILSDVTCNTRVWSGNRTFYTLGTTSIPDWRRENGGNRVNSAGLLINLEDLHSEYDLNVKLSNQVRKAIKSIQIGDNAAVDFSGEANPDPVLFYQSGQTVKITSGARLNLTYKTTNATYKATEDITDAGYVYTFTVPSNNSVTQITAQRWYEYQIESEGDDKLTGIDMHVIPEQARHQIASLKADDHEYLSNFDKYVEMTIDPNFELQTNSVYQYYSLDANGNETQLNEKPSAVGSYRVKAGIFFYNNGQSQEYWMTKDVKITRRNYTNHSGENAVQGEDEMKATVTVGNGTNSYSAYSGEAQIPHISITDTNYKGNRSLVRGTDYEVYIKADNEYVLVEDDTLLAQTNVGDYTFYVKFIGNYTSGVEYEPFAWRIINANINAEGLAPTANTLTYNTTAQTLVTEGTSASDYGTTYYKLVGVDGAEWSTTIPTRTNAGTYNVQWYIKGGINYNDLGSEANPAGTVMVTINPKAVEDPRIELNGGAFVYDGTAKTYDEESISVYDGNDLIAPSEYAFSHGNNINAGTNTAYVTVTDNVVNGNYVITETNKYFTIQKATPTVSIALANANGIIYDGEKVETVHGDAVAGKDFVINDTNPESNVYSVEFYADSNGTKGEKLNEAPINAGTYWAVVTLAASDNYNAATNEMKFVIQQKDIACVTIEAGFPTADADAVTPTGKAPTSLTVKDGVTVLTDADYTAEFSDNIYSTNSAKITLTGKGNYKGTKEGAYSVLTTLDISAVKDLITKITDTNGDTINADALSDTFVTKIGYNFTVYSKGKLQFSGLETQPEQHLDNNGWFYTFNIPTGVNKCTVTHEYAYRTQQTPADSIDANGDVIISGYDANVKSEGNENVYLNIVKVHFDPVYYLDNPADKVTVKSVDNPAPGTSYEVISKKFFDNTGKEIDVSKPLNVGTYRVEIKVRVFYGVGEGENRPHQDVYVKRNFEVKARSSENVTVSIAEDRFVYDGTAKTAEITVTDSKRAANAPMVRGTDYEYGYYTGTGEERVWHAYEGNNFLTNTNVGDYSVIVRFKGNYSGEKEVIWHITNATLPGLKIVPDEDLVYNHKTHQVKVLPKNEGDVIPEGSVLIKYGDATATADQWATLDENAPIDAGKYKAFIKLNDSVSYAFASDQITSIDFEVQKKNIESTDITFTYPQFSIQENPSYYLKCEPITAKDGEYDLVKDADFAVVTYATNKPIEDFPVLINGMGNYTGCTYLYWDLISESDAVKLSITDPVATVNSSGKGRVSSTFNSEVMEGVEIVEKGILYVKDAECATELTLDNVGINGIGKKQSESTSQIGNQTLNVIDAGDGAKLRGYITIKYGETQKTLYTEEVSGTYLELAIDEAANVNISAPKATVNATSGAKRVSATFTFDIKDGYTVTESGILYVKDENCATELTLENIGTANIGKKVSTENAGSQTLNVTDSGSGAKLRGYVIVSVDGVSKTFYSNEVSGNYADLAIEDAATVNMSAAAATVNPSTGAKRVSSTFTFHIKDGYSVVESGILYVKDAECTKELTLDNVGLSGINKKVSAENAGSQTLNVTDSGSGAKLRGYVTVSDGTHKKTFYADEVSGTYAELSANE